MNKTLGIILHGVTGRMGTNQHLIRSIKSIQNEGGIKLSDGNFLNLDVILSGRDKDKLSNLSKKHQISKWTTDLDKILQDSSYQVFFDSASTKMRAENITKAIKYNKHIYCEKPSAEKFQEAYDLFLLAEKKFVRHGVVQDKLFLPGLIKLKKLIQQNFFGKILSVKIDFGYWVFTGKDENQPSQRPSWNYRKEEGGSIIIDMMCHWQYIITHLFGEIEDFVCMGKNHISTRYDNNAKSYHANADDACYAIVNLKNGILVQINSDWCTRVRKDDLVTFKVDGELGSALATLSQCYLQPLDKTPRPIWNPDEKQKHNFFNDWELVFENETYENAFKTQWILFLKHIAEGSPWDYGLEKGAEAVRFAELALKSWKEKKWINLS